MTNWEILLWIGIVYAIIEFFMIIWVKNVRKNFQWLITNKDEKPFLSKEGLKKFFLKGYDPELGWIRKPNTSDTEIGKFGNVSWNINEKGSRINPNFEQLQSEISCYGDSFTFCRQVNDDETWEHFLSEMETSNVLNFGVGNYGLDQTLLRLKREYPKNRTKYVILGVVPDTISRIMSYWKHYYEYGNTFGFKPKFILNNDSLELIKNKIDDESKFEHYYQFLKEVKKLDYFYKNKFSNEKIHFPYFFSLLKNAKRNFSILFWVTLIQLLKNLGKNYSIYEWKPMDVIMKINHSWRLKLYSNNHATQLLKKIIEEYVIYAKKNNFIPIFMFLPQKDDIHFINNNFHFYKEFQQSIREIKELHTIDITNEFLNKQDFDKFYSDDNEYGGHLSKEGNHYVAEIIHSKLMAIDSY
jgi:hypothetical protein